ncbi:MAG: toll/interleukin-1 receptor domain-containing protein [Opitutus sp.]|nr:toll/interleukin-1 receptor domain-containing protein [Opitutus sp.]
MSETAGKAVFLSYASQDVAAALRICAALRAAGVEVWFDQDALVGGDAWDQKIRGQIGACALFIPVISANTQERREGYFRLEWHLAEDRMRLIAKGTPFIVPVTVDGTSERGALVPDASPPCSGRNPRRRDTGGVRRSRAEASRRTERADRNRHIRGPASRGRCSGHPNRFAPLGGRCTGCGATRPGRLRIWRQPNPTINPSPCSRSRT